MKKNALLYALFLGLFLSIAACSKKEDPQPTPDPLVGTWDMDKINISFAAPYQSLGGDRTPSYFGYERYQHIISSDKTFFTEIRYIPKYGGDIISEIGDWTASANKLMLNYDGGSDQEFEFSNNQLSQQDSGNIKILPTGAKDSVVVQVTLKYTWIKTK